MADVNYILAHWCYFTNFGDALNPYLLEKLSGKKVLFCKYHRREFGIKREILSLARSLLRCQKYDFRRLCLVEKKKPVVLAVGSILSRSLPNYKIWGAGFMNFSEKAAGGQVFAVRGKYSEQMLRQQGFVVNGIYGDPALLLPLVYKGKKEQKRKLGIIPHHSEYASFKNRFADQFVINLKRDDIESVIDDIISCEYVLSTSLHGVIVAHAYGIPALWIKEGNINTDGIKFRDYFSSVGIEEYDGSLFKFENFILDELKKIPENIKELMLPKVNLLQIQRSLLNVAPFDLAAAYRNIG